MTDDEPLILTRAMEAVWEYGPVSPTVLLISTRFLFNIARATRTKRQFRRWRGKYRAALRAARREAS